MEPSALAPPVIGGLRIYQRYILLSNFLNKKSAAVDEATARTEVPPVVSRWFYGYMCIYMYTYSLSTKKRNAEW